MYKALYLSPMIPSYNLHETGSFFKNILAFEVLMDTETYAIYHKDNLTIHLLRAGEDIGQMEFYLEVDDLNIIWERVQSSTLELKVRAPFDQPYGMREIHIGVPHTKTLLMIGQEMMQH